MKTKLSKCRVCKAEYEKRSMGHIACSAPCALEFVKAKTEKAKKNKELRESRELKQRKESLKTRSDWLKEAQAVLNKYIREKYANEPCISCGRHHQGQYHAGHYLSVGAHPELRFEEMNIWKQCQPCNVHLSGNLLNYRKALIAREGVGIKIVEWLEGPHEPKKYSIDELKDMIALYKKKIKALNESDVPR